MKTLKAALRTARALMAKGLLGQELRQEIEAVYPNLSEAHKTKLAKRLKQEVGVLGQVAHDPNQYPSCKIATQAKEQHPHPHTLILTYRTPMCGSCVFNTRGACRLMGGKLISGPDDVPEEAVKKTAALLVRDNDLTPKEAARIANSKHPPVKRVAALHILKSQDVQDDTRDMQAAAESRRVAAMLDNSGVSLTIEEGTQTGPGRTVNADRKDLDLKFTEQPGDDRIARRASRIAKQLQPGEMTIELPKEWDDSPVASLNKAVTNVPPREKSQGRTATALDEHGLQVQEAHDKLVRLASKALGKGCVSTVVAEQMHARIDQYQQYGAVANAEQKPIIQQIAALSGELEL